MKEGNRDDAKNRSAIQCIEVLIARNCIRNSSHNLFWTLSLYSLQNEPVKKNRSLHNSEIFHFMTYDWKRTIQKLLEDHKIQYSIIQYFSADNVFGDTAGASLQDDEQKFLAAASDISENLGSTSSDLILRLVNEERKDLMFDEKLP